MTAVNSSKGSSKNLFGTYFKYRLGIMKMNFVMCCILNVLGLPLLAVAAGKGFGGAISEFSATARFFSMICIAALPAIAIFNALSSFDYYHKKDLTDTIGVLPLSHKQRFFADLLAGLIVNAVPIIPCGIFCTIAFANLQGKFLARYNTAMLGNFHMAGIGLYIAASVLFIVIFTYLFTVLTSVCCGKVFHSVVFVVIAIAVLPLIFGGLAQCFAKGILGIDDKEYFWEAVKLFPPAGLIHSILDAVDAPFSGYLGYFIEHNELVTFSFWQILVYLILAAGIIALAYFLGKRRLAEHTGSAFAIKPMFWVLSGGITAAITITTLCTSSEFYGYGGLFHSYHIFSAAAGLLTCLVTVLLYRQKKKTFLRTLAVGAGAVVVMLAAWVVVDKTGSFGARYYPKSADGIEYIKINSTYTITEKKDIEDFASMLNKELRDNPKGLQYSNNGGFFVEMKKTDGERTLRGFSNAPVVEQIIRSLDGYLDYFFGELEDSPEEWKAYLSYRYMANHMVSSARTWVHDEDVDELIKILHEEAKEKHDPNAKTVIEIVFYGGSNGDRSFAIGENFTRTIAYLSDVSYDLDDNHAVIYLSIEYDNYGVNQETFLVRIPFEDKDDERVKELVSLLEVSEGEPIDPNFRMRVFNGPNEPGVTEENKPRVLELMRELAADYMFN